MFRKRGKNFTLAIPKVSTPKTSTIFTKAIIRLEGPGMLIPLSDFNDCNSRKLPITNLLSPIYSFSSTLKKHSGHKRQKFITHSVSCVMSRNFRQNGINTDLFQLYPFQHWKETLKKERNGLNPSFEKTLKQGKIGNQAKMTGFVPNISCMDNLP